MSDDGGYGITVRANMLHITCYSSGESRAVKKNLAWAAPKMLEALQEIIAQAEQLGIGADWDDRGFYGLKHGRAAIAKATGGGK